MSRIIAGRRRGHRLTVPAHGRTRPTSDRVRESAFNLVASWAHTAGEPADVMLHRFSFLDLYAGSGAIGLEAASRGASPVVAVEKDGPTAAVARRNAGALGLDVSVVAAPVERYLAAQTRRAFDIVWLDPPYDVASDRVAAVLAGLVSGGWLAADGLVVLERASRDVEPAWPAHMRSTWSRRYGDTTLYFATPEAGEAEEDS